MKFFIVACLRCRRREEVKRERKRERGLVMFTSLLEGSLIESDLLFNLLVGCWRIVVYHTQGRFE